MAVERHFSVYCPWGRFFLTPTLISGTYHVLQAVTPENYTQSDFPLSPWISFGTFVLVIGDWAGGGKRVIIYAISGIILLHYLFW